MAKRIVSDYELNPVKNPTLPFVVVCFGMLDYRILSEHETEKEAQAELKFILAEEHRMKVAAKGYTRDPLKQDFDVRTPEDLDALVEAIRSTYA